MRGVVTQWYHRADKSATATRDPAPSPVGYGSDFPELSAQRPAVSVYCPLILQQALRKPLLIYLKGTFRHRGIKWEGKRVRSREWMKWLKQKEQKARNKRKNTNRRPQCLKISHWFFLKGVFSSVPGSLRSFESVCYLLVGLLGSSVRPSLQDAFLVMIRNVRPVPGWELATAAANAP